MKSDLDREVHEVQLKGIEEGGIRRISADPGYGELLLREGKWS